MSRFPDNVVQAALTVVEALPINDLRAQARARGANAAHEWICWLFGSAEAPKANVGFELPEAHNPTKLAFVRLLKQTVDLFEKVHKFNNTQGYAQLAGKRDSLVLHEAFGFYDAIDMLADQFNLWASLELADALDSGKVETPRLIVHKTDSTRAGGCNFCPTNGLVYEVSSPIRTLKIRMCPECVKAFRTQTRRV